MPPGLCSHASVATALAFAYCPTAPLLVPTARNWPEGATAAAVISSEASDSGGYKAWCAEGSVGSAVRLLTYVYRQKINTITHILQIESHKTPEQRMTAWITN